MAAPFNAHHEWSRRLEDEFFAQGDKERELGMSITPLMDRQKPGVMEPTNQITFANVVVIPMLEAWAEVAGEGSRSLLQQARDNQQQWQRVAHSEAARSLSGMNQEV